MIGPQAPDDADTRRWVLAATILGSSLAFIDGSVVNVALPAIQADLASTVAAAQWVVNAYLLLLGALVLIGGAAGDRFGRRRLFVWGVALFAAASLACALAPNGAALVAARAFQGIASALLVPNSLAIISAVYPKDKRGAAIGLWAGASALTTSFGPLLGGWLVDTLSWRAIFFINLPVALVALLLAVARMPESRDETAPSEIDWRGGLLATLGLGALVFGLTEETSRGWADPLVQAALAAGALILILFLWVEARARAPMVPLALFRSRAFSGANAITLLLYASLGGALFFLPYELIRLQHYSAAETGAAFLPFPLIMGLLSPWSGGLVARYGARLPLTVGPVVVAFGYALLARPGIGDSYWTGFFPAMIVLGLGMAASVAPLTTTVMGAVEERHAGTASGINNAVARLASMFAVALLGALAVGLFGQALDRRLAALGAAPEIRRAVEAEVPRLAEARLPDSVAGEARTTLAPALDAGLLDSFRLTILTAGLLALLAAPCAYLTIPSSPPRLPPHR
jgi:EmrB/QacA subfamily drug resistance transporter